MDATGAIYGTTSEGDDAACLKGKLCGTVFKLTPSGSTYLESTLFLFSPSGNSSDGYHPAAGVIGDANGAIYGTALLGGGSTGEVLSLS